MSKWLLVLASGLMGCVGFGAVFALGVLQPVIANSTGWSRAEISLAMTLVFIALALGSFFWGAMRDRGYPVLIAMSGVVLVASGLFLASLAQHPWQFQICFGLLPGFGVAALAAPAMANVNILFDKNRGLAVALVSIGFGMAPMTMSPLVQHLLGAMAWQNVLRVLALFVLGLLLFLPLLRVTQAPPTAVDDPKASADAAATADSGQFRWQPFLVLLVVYFFCCAAHSGPIFHTVSYAQWCGLSAGAATSIYAIEGASGMIGRFVFGMAADRFPVRRVIVAGLLLQAIGILAYGFAQNWWAFAFVASFLGMGYSGVMPLYTVLSRQLFGVTNLGAILGAEVAVSSLGMSLGPWIGGALFDATASYFALYVLSAAFGLMAVLAAAILPMRPTGPAMTPQSAH